MTRFAAPAFVVVAALSGASACKTPTQPTTLSAIVTSVQTVGATSFQATLQNGQAPAASGGPTADVTGPPTAVDDGASSFDVTGSAPFRKILVSVADGSASLNGFFELDLGADVTSQKILATFGSTIPRTSFTLKFQIVTAAGQIGAVKSVPTTVVSGTAVTASLTASVSPDPAPYLSGGACALFPGAVCGYEFEITVREHNRVNVSIASVQMGFTDPLKPHAPSFPVTALPGGDSVRLLGGIICDMNDADCKGLLVDPIDFLADQRITIAIAGTDANGHPVNLSTSVLLKAAPGASRGRAGAMRY